MKIWLGLIFIVLAIVGMLWSGNKSNDVTHYNRAYTVTEKNQGEHRYKGSYYDDYFLTVKYVDDSTHCWVKGVRGETYFSVQVGSRYLEREEKSLAFYFIIAILLFAFGLFFFFDGLDE